jgi:hypothetical protein
MEISVLASQGSKTSNYEAVCSRGKHEFSRRAVRPHDLSAGSCSVQKGAGRQGLPYPVGVWFPIPDRRRQEATAPLPVETRALGLVAAATRVEVGR